MPDQPITLMAPKYLHRDMRALFDRMDWARAYPANSNQPLAAPPA
jgi:hypothetical protein